MKNIFSKFKELKNRILDIRTDRYFFVPFRLLPDEIDLNELKSFDSKKIPVPDIKLKYFTKFF